MVASEDVILSKVLEDKRNWEEVLDHGYGASFFELRRKEFLFIQGHYNQYGELPALDVVQRYHPNWNPVTHQNGMEFWLKELQNDRDLRVQNKYIEDWYNQKKNGASPSDLQKILLKMQMELLEGVGSTKDLDLTNIDAEKRRWEERKAAGDGVIGIPFGIPSLDQQTGGARPGDLGVIMGPPKNMKTWEELFVGYNMWTSGRSGLLISKEMSELQMATRLRWFDLRNVPYQLFRNAQLGQYEQQYLDTLEEIRGQRKPFIISADDGDMDTGGGVSLIASKIDRYRPEFVLIDGAYLISDDRGESDWKAIKNVFRDLKRLARRKQVPIIVTTQPQRLKEKNGEPLRRKMIMEDVGGAYSIAQDCDYMIGVRRIGRDVLENYLIGIREGDLAEWQMRLDLDMGIVEQLSGDQLLSEEEKSFDFGEEVSEEISGQLLY